ncbi:MAG TPA: amidase [Blastocatellia bacterium]|nr:amidase [Blastocatellia bacterium]
MKKDSREKSARKKSDSSNKVNRRTFVKLLPAAGATAVAATRLDVAAAITEQAQPAQPPPQRVTKEMLHSAEQLIDIELTPAQEDMALPGVNRNLAAYESLRKIDVPLDTEPAILFHPALPGKQFNTRQTPFKLSKQQPPPFKSVEEVAFFTAAQLGELIRTRRLSPVELTRMYIARLKRYGPKLNCVVTLMEETGMKQAEQAEAEIKSGKYRGPLHGIPWGAKDLFATRGTRTTWGAEPFREQMIDLDATVVERLREAGAVLVAKLSMGALAQGPRWFGGVTRNPWVPDEDRIGSSGSSAGSAAATSAGLVGFAVGTETLGSIVSPSSRCGVVGLRPTYGRISRYGAMGLSWTMDKIGPLCRGVEDCAAVLRAAYGPDGRDLTVGDAAFNWSPDRPLAAMRIGFLKAEFERKEDSEATKAMYKEALDALRAAGAQLQETELPKFDTGSLRIILSAEAATAFDDITRDGRVNQLSGQSPGDWPNSFRTSRFITAVEYLRAQRARTLLMRQMDQFMSKWDVFVSPAPGSASLLITNLTGHPAVCLPCGFIDNLPRSLMFTGGLYDEAAPLRVALAFERATKWHTMHPKMDWA